MPSGGVNLIAAKGRARFHRRSIRGSDLVSPDGRTKSPKIYGGLQWGAGERNMDRQPQIALWRIS
jgi:hypothetical protein